MCNKTLTNRYQVSNEVASADEKSDESELDGGGNVLLDVPLDEVFVFSH